MDVAWAITSPAVSRVSTEGAPHGGVEQAASHRDMAFDEHENTPGVYSW